MKNNNKSVYEKVAEKFLGDFSLHLEKIEKGEAQPIKWRKYWINKGFHNPLSDKPFTGNYNNAMLSLYSNFLNFSDTRFITFAQLQAFNQQNKTSLLLKKGSAGIPMLFPISRKIEDENGNVASKLSGFSSYYVFNISHVEGYEEVWGKSEIPEEIQKSNLYNIYLSYLNREKINISFGGDSAYYDIINDEMALPTFEQFENDASFLLAIGHETTHSTGSKNRLNRNMSGKFGSSEYAYEELIAETTSYSLLSAHFKSEIDTNNSLAYISGWKQAIKNFNANEILKLQAEVQKAIFYIVGDKVK